MFSKRLFDLSIAIPAIILLAPFLLFIGALVRLDSRGPIFFSQTRVGRFGSPFRILKFRTLTIDSRCDRPSVTAADDPRITRIGRVLREYKLDELPQLFNVVRGEMSLVGPRPEQPEHAATFPHNIREKVLSVPPGVTGAGAIRFRNETDYLRESDDPEAVYINDILPIKLGYDEKYVDQRSLLLDLRILFLTAVAILRRRDVDVFRAGR